MEVVLTLLAIAILGLLLLNSIYLVMWRQQMKINADQAEMNKSQSELNALMLAIAKLREKRARKWVDPLDAKDEEVQS